MCTEALYLLQKCKKLNDSYICAQKHCICFRSAKNWTILILCTEALYLLQKYKKLNDTYICAQKHCICFRSVKNWTILIYVHRSTVLQKCKKIERYFIPTNNLSSVSRQWMQKVFARLTKDCRHLQLLQLQRS